MIKSKILYFYTYVNIRTQNTRNNFKFDFYVFNKYLGSTHNCNCTINVNFNKKKKNVNPSKRLNITIILG